MLLSSIVFIPLLGGLLILLMNRENEWAIKTMATIAAAIPVILAGWLYYCFDQSTADIQFAEKMDWIPSLGVSYFLGVDGLGLPMVIVTSLLSLVAITVSWNIKTRVKEYFALFLILETGMMGVFVALDLFLFYIFWELVLVPMYFIIGVWGGPRKEYAAIKFIIYTVVGSVFMLLGFLAIYFTSDPHTFNIIELSQGNQFKGMLLFQNIAYLALFLGFAVKVPIFPFHTWLPDAHVEAPTAGSIILAGVLLKMGAYGLMRVCFPILPEAAVYFAHCLAGLALINILYGAFTALAQTDLKKMIAYSSVSHMGYVLLGMSALTVTGFNGALLQMFNHGIITGALFMLVGVIYDRAHTREIAGFGGIGKQMPAYTGLMAVAVMAAVGLPGLAGFISELLCFVGAFPVYKLITSGAVLGVLLSAVYMLGMFQRIFTGELNPKWAELKDADFREWISLLPLMALIVLLGFYPRLILDVMNMTITHLIPRFQ
ncbi:MAG: NADH-quinone oxidoreductase subunit M [bacterium]|nr:NADH-quinone oxidoreductase subunit M [bacterium]